MLELAIELAREAGRVLMRHLGRLSAGDVTHKGRVNLVTAADREAEALILGRIRGAFPDHAVMAEESAPGAREASHLWIVDPLDGTTNFVHGYPFFAVSIALEVEGEPHLGVIHAPMMNETFHAERVRGASLNGVPIRVSGTSELIDSLLATGFAYDRWSRDRNNLEEFCALTMATRGVRRGGAASLDLAYVAAGRLDGYWEMGLRPWDVAAGALIVREAGGTVTDLEGGDRWRSGETIVAANGSLHGPLTEALDRSSA